MKRRQFITAAAFLTGGFLVNGCAPAKTKGESKKIKGYVTRSGKGLKNVVVSDGYTVIATDKKGYFEFAPNALSKNVFISTPSGYEFMHTKYVSRHYRSLINYDYNTTMNFELKLLAENDDEHSFIIWADPQVKNSQDVQKMMKNSVPDVQNFIKNSAPGTLIHGITVGDIVWDNLPLYAAYDKAVQEMGVPFFQCLGNHDMDYDQGGDRESSRTFEKNYGPTTYSFNRGKVHYVVIDDVRYLGEGRAYDGYFQDCYLDWLRKDLQFVDKDKLIVLCTHIPVHNGVLNKSALYDILSGRKVHIMSGHTHYNQNVIEAGFYEHNHGTVCGAWWTGSICSDGTPNGYGVYSVKGNEIQWHYQATGEAADHQMKIFVNDVDDNQKQVVVNIWNYDEGWKTNYAIDGLSKGSLEQYKGFDPEAYKNLLGPDLPQKRGFAEPRLTEHLFRTLVPIDTKEIAVTATDRFGRNFQEIFKV